MNFASAYAYDYGFEGSDEEDVSDQGKVSNVKKIRRADTNIISVAFDELISTNQMFAGEPIKCKKCEAIMCKISRDHLTQDNKIWECEFCNEQNPLNIANLDMIPNDNDITFLIEPAPFKEDEKKTPSDHNVSSDDKYLTYCVDISGSMDTHVPVNGNNNAQSMTRLSAVKIACVESLSNLKNQEPNKRVSLVTFSDEVKYYGDATNSRKQLTLGESYNNYPPNQSFFRNQAVQKKPTKSRLGSLLSKIKPSKDVINNSEEEEVQNSESEIPVDIMSNQEKMLALGSNQDGNLKAIKESHTALENRIKALRTEGSTALGPALTFSIGYSSRLPGSQIILCTDGCANVGMGCLDNGSDNAEKFYEDLATYAKSKGVVVNVITMEGTDCKLALLGKVADLTNGNVNIVNPLNLSEEFKSILSKRLIATNVTAKLIVNTKYLYIRDEDYEEAEAKAYESEDPNAKQELEKLRKSIVEKNIGNANIETEITFEYGIRRLSDEEKKKIEKLDKLPFQLQINYTMPDGAKALRVCTKIQEFTRDRSRAEKDTAWDVICTDYAQKMSNQVSKSSVQAAQYRAQRLQNYSANNNNVMPEMLSDNVFMVRNMSNDFRSAAMTDTQTRDMLKCKKVNRKFFK